MLSEITHRLAELGITLPEPAVPLANYLPFVRSGDLVFVSGQLPSRGGVVAYTGRVSVDIATDGAQTAAQLCFINLLAQLSVACEGDLNRVHRVVRLAGYIAAPPEFIDHATVMNGASDLAVAVFGEAGRHARCTVGVASLPANACVEIEGVFEIG